MKDTKHHFAEYVSPGHPDRLTDAIAESIVDYAIAHDDRALVGVEVAVHTNKVFVDGRVAFRCGRDEELALPLNEIVRRVYANAGYNGCWKPEPSSIEVTQDICLERLRDDEAEIRPLSDDQNIVLGFATADENTNHLPVAHFLAQQIGNFLFDWKRNTKEAASLGPDFKLLPHIVIAQDDSGKQTIEWQRLTLSIQHRRNFGYEQQHRLFFPLLKRFLNDAEQNLGLAGLGRSFSLENLFLNGAGDFHIGGPEGDNGLSGKKLVVDHYGPEVPIGGGALCGKDPHKIDRVGPLRARQLAKQIARAHDKSAEVRLAWSPGETHPHHVEASVIHSDGQRIAIKQLPPPEWFNIETIFYHLQLRSVCWRDAILRGFFADKNASWEAE